MTLNLSVVGRDVAIQVSDRHLSYAQTVRGRASGLHDVYANKNVVFAPSYGLVSLGYTGLAYLERGPADAWIARQLWLDDLGSGRSYSGIGGRNGRASAGPWTSCAKN